MAAEQIKLKILVDKVKNRVVYAESRADFANILLSFLTLPMGTIIRLAEKQSKIGCMYALYESVENMETQYFETEACKSMLLRPRMDRDSELQCSNLVHRMDGHKNYYVCPTWTCCTETYRLFSMFKNSKCPCGKEMSYDFVFHEPDADDVFVRGMERFIITDDLHIKPVSTTSILSQLCKLGIKDMKSLEERNITLGQEEVLHLLKRCVVSTTPLTDLILPKQEDLSHPFVIPKMEPFYKTNSNSKHISLKVLFSKSNNKILYAEAKEDFLDFLFSFLTFPLGSIAKLLSESSSMGSVDNLYKSVLTLCNDDDVILENCRDLLINPKVAFHYGIKNQLLQIDEAEPNCISFLRCEPCFSEGKIKCQHGLKNVSLKLINPKLVDTVTKSRGGYLKAPLTFMVTDDLVLKPISTFSSISLISNLGVPLSDLAERVVSVSENEALSLLMASLTRKNVLSHVFCQKNPKAFEELNRYASY